MYIIDEIFKEKYTKEQLNDFHCPGCSTGIIKLDITSLNYKESLYSKETPPTSKNKHGVFCGFLICQEPDCRESVVFSGEYEIKYRIVNNEVKQKSYFKPNFFSPAIPIFDIDFYLNKIPVEAYNAIEMAFSLFWIDRNSSINKIRVAIEDILTNKGIKKTENIKGKRVKLSLHKRIELFRIKHPRIADALLALKWIGNEGSHSNEDIGYDYTLDTFKILEFTLESLYKSKEKEISILIKEVNKRKKIT